MNRLVIIGNGFDIAHGYGFVSISVSENLASSLFYDIICNLGKFCLLLRGIN